MTERERFLNYMQFRPVDRIPLMEMGVWPETLDRWHLEGLPPWVTGLRQLEDYLRLDRSFNCNWLPINDGIYPPFVPRVISETDEEVIVADGDGVICRQRKQHRTIPQYLEFPIKDESDYLRLRSRLSGVDPARYSADFAADLHWRRQRGEIIGVNFKGFFGFPRNHMGVENWCLAFYDQPQLVQRLIADRVQFGKELLRPLLDARVLDFVQIWEDMSYKTASLISPQCVRQYMLPAYRELVTCLREGGVQVIMVDSDGQVDELTPLFLAAGCDGVHPCEMAAGSDPLLLRRRHPNCTLMGGMDKRAIASGREGVDAELARLAPLWEDGAFIPMLDHFVPPDVSYSTYCYYVERRRELLSRPHGGR